MNNKRPLLSLVAVCGIFVATPSGALNLGSQPLYLGSSIPPIVMLMTPKDHQLFKKAYDDFSDLDATLPGGDTALETTYKHSIEYYGYFDPYKCYVYSSARNRFEPSTTTTDKYCSPGTAWAGNFLNWATMARIDVMRKLLYGGKRSTDSNSVTVLERELIPTEAHSWAKHYRGSDIAQLVPFANMTSSDLSLTSSSSISTGTGSKSFSVSLPSGKRPFIVGDQLTVTNSSSRYMIGEITAVSGGSGTVTVTFNATTAVGTGSRTSWTVTNWSHAGISICNTTQATSGTSHASTAPPLLRAAWGDFSLWGVGDGTACRWSDEGGGPNGNTIADSEMTANSKAPPRATSINANLNVSGVTNGDYVMRVKVCDPSLIGTERCAQYPNGNLKPIGLLQQYAAGQQKKIKFGLFTGSYMKNKSGGVLRKNPDFLDSATSANPSNYNASTDEIDPGTGIFNTSVAGIVRTFDSLRMYGYTFAAGTGSYSAADGCGLLSPDPTEGNCTSWGNPLSELFVESLRYLAGKPSATAAFTYSEASGQKDYDLGLRQPTWSNPLTQANYCTPLNVIVMNASVNSYDNDQVPSDLWSAGTTAKTLTSAVGDLEGIGGNFLIGNNGTTNDGICSPKSVGSSGRKLGDLYGICPEAPALRGSYQLAGPAYWAHTNKIRSDLTVPVADTKSLKVTTYGVALASAVPTIQIPVPGSSPTRYVTLQPTARTFNGSTDRGHGSIVDFKVIRQDLAAGTGKFFVSWEDSTQGNDYDLDMWGFISYRFLNSNTQIEVTSDVVYAAAGHSIAFGYVISGTAANEGAHFHSAHKGNQIISYNYPGNFNTGTGNNECNNCQDSDGPNAKVYNLSASGSAQTLKEPLWYASKYGGFTDANGNNQPDSLTEWDGKLNLTGGPGTDGNPDNYFPVTNPGALEQSLDRAFVNVLQVSSASSVATNSTSLQSGSIVYQARFNANEWSGQLLAFGISTTGAINPIPLWDASQLMPAADSRTIVTFNHDTTAPWLAASPKGIPFRWTSLNSDQTAALNTNPVGITDPAGTLCTGVSGTGFTPAGCTLQGSLRLNYLRGDQANEGATASKYRVRPTTVLGDIVNSTPVYVGAASTVQYGDFSPPAAAYSSDASYTTFIGGSAGTRTPMIYAGANDGMLHGFDASVSASQGIEKLAYVPSTTYRAFTKLTDKTYSHRYYVDGSPTVADVKFSDGTWHTILVAGLNAGGQGVYALDITDPATFSEGNANNIVLWEWTDENDNWLGNTYSQPTVAKVKNGAGFKYVVIFGNGYNNSIGSPGDTQISPSGCATFYMMAVDGGVDGNWTFGTDYQFVDVTVGCNAADPNGLATPKVVDVDGDGYADYAYAGDLRGNVWKFDIRDWSSPQLAFGATTPLFTARDPAGNPQPITTGMTTSAGPLIGSTMVMFGTGKYLEQSDDSPPFQTQTVYGLLDKNDGSTIASTRAAGVYANLMQQQVLGASASNPLGTTVDNPATPLVDEGGFRITTPYQPNYTATARANTQFGVSNPAAQDAIATTPPQNGWYMDFPFSGDYTNPSPPPATATGTGERVAFRPIISTGKLVVTTLVPSTIPCESGGTSFIMDLDPRTGSRLTVSPFDVNGDLNFTSSDFIADPYGNLVAVTGKASTIGIVPTPTVIQMTPGGGGSPGSEVKVLSGSSGALMSIIELGGGGGSPGAAGRRIQWRQLFTD